MGSLMVHPHAIVVSIGIDSYYSNVPEMSDVHDD